MDILLYQIFVCHRPHLVKPQLSIIRVGMDIYEILDSWHHFTFQNISVSCKRSVWFDHYFSRYFAISQTPIVYHDEESCLKMPSAKCSCFDLLNAVIEVTDRQSVLDFIQMMFLQTICWQTNRSPQARVAGFAVVCNYVSAFVILDIYISTLSHGVCVNVVLTHLVQRLENSREIRYIIIWCLCKVELLCALATRHT